MRLISISFLWLFCALNIYSQNICVKRQLQWKQGLNSVLLQDAVFKDKVSGSSVYFEAFSFPENMSVHFFAKEWDTISSASTVNLSSLPDSFSYNMYTAQSRKVYISKVYVNPLCRSVDSRYLLRLKSFEIIFTPTEPVMSQKKATDVRNSVLATGRWYKIKVKQNGIYKLSYAQLKDMGFDNPENVGLFGYSGEMLPKNTNLPKVDDLLSIPLYNNGESILFYGHGVDVWKYDDRNKIYLKATHKFSDYSYYYLSDANKKSLLPSATNSNLESTITVQSFDDFDYHESDEINFLKSGSEWYGDIMTTGQHTSIKFNFPNIDNSAPAKVYYNFLSKSVGVAIMAVKAGETIDSVLLYNDEVKGQFLFVPTSNNFNVVATFSNNNDLNGEGYIDYLGVNVRRSLVMSGNQMLIRDATYAGSSKNIKYLVKNASADISVWDITDVNKPQLITSAISGTDLSFYAISDTLRTFILFNKKTGILAPEIDKESIALVKNQNIHGAEVPDLIIVTPDSQAIYDQAMRLAQFRIKNNGLKVLLVKIGEVYNEFSAGKRDVTAIRNLVKYFYERGKTEGHMLSYILLFGDGTYVNKVDYDGNNNLLPTYQSSNSYISSASYVTDDYFGWMDYKTNESTNLIDVGVGRLPVKNYSEALDVVNKLIAYENPANDDDWRNVVCFIGDDEDSNKHIEQADGLAENIETNYPNFLVQKIYLDAFPQIKTSSGEAYPGVFDAINNRVNSGALIVNYTGHGNERQLAHENIINIKSIRSWNNKNKLPLFITATCEFSRWDDVNFNEKRTLTSAGEEVLLNPIGGAIAMLTTTRLVYSEENNELNQSFYKYVFNKDENGNFYRLGDVFRLSKNFTGTGVNKLNFTLLGDPSMVLAFPKHQTIRTDSINNKFIADASIIIDTIRALSIANIVGHVEDDFGNKKILNAIMSVTVLDKPDTLTTLANDPDSQPFQFTRQEGALFKGLVEVQNGEFSFEFPVPADIKYNFNTGRILYYAASPDGSYSGRYDKIVVGGLKERTNNGYGPNIRLFMNDTNFVNGGITNSNPVLIVQLKDENGLNASGIGVGHDITAVLNDDFSQIYNLNGNYRTKLNDYRQGETNYTFTQIPLGTHTVKVTSWDIFNNSEEESLTFRVVGENGIELNKVYNYPNPMRDFTNFSIEHNRPNENITIEIYIYSFTGALVNVLKTSGTFSGFRTPPLRWNGIDMDGHKAENGIYPYRVVLKNNKEESVQAYGKLLIMH